jgi:NADH-quinone oxidoreductase subunit F
LVKISSLAELQKLNQEYKPLLKLRQLEHNHITSESKAIEKREILVCGGTGCKASRSDQIIRNLNIYRPCRSFRKS